MPEGLSPLSIGLSGVGTLAKMGVGIGQLINAKKWAKTKRPQYEIPPALLSMMNMGLPGQGRTEANMDRASAGTIKGITSSQQSPSAMLAGLVAQDENSKNAVADLGIQAAQNQFNTMNQVANEQKQQWAWDKQDPYLNAMAAAHDLKNAGLQNLVGGVDNLGNAASKVAYMGGFDNMFGNKGNNTNPSGSGMPMTGQQQGWGARLGNITGFAGGTLNEATQRLFSPQGQSYRDNFDNFMASQGGNPYIQSPDDIWNIQKSNYMSQFPNIDEDILKGHFFRTNKLIGS